MNSPLEGLLTIFDGWVLAALTPIAIYLVISGVDDLFIDVAWVWTAVRGAVTRQPPFQPPPADSSGLPERRIAIFVPLWNESQVIASMLAHNAAAIRYSNYAFFAGAYPNDEPTLKAVREMQARLPNVHLAICPHEGPTSKADCLNWIYQHMLLREEQTGERFDLMVTHDAEDIIHPESLRWMNYYAAEYDFIQIPVLALSTPMLAFTHGVYCDEFAEFQTRDLPVRNRLGGFVPSAGVGTGYSRRALEALAGSGKNCVFDPVCLTEDYENGRRLHDLGFKQLYVPPVKSACGWVATREYFPQSRQAAIRQRTRWVTGIALQGWERHGWAGRGQWYWAWRDRKGLIGSPLSLVTNLITVYGLISHMWVRILPPAAVVFICWFTMALQSIHLLVRMGCVARIYGWTFALLAPFRLLVANYVNCVATLKALERFAVAKIKHQPLVWLKTEHCYPSRMALSAQRRKLGEILTGSNYITRRDLEHALATQPTGLRLGAHLVALGLLTECELYEALAIQQGLPFGAPAEVSRRAARSLPAHVVREWKVLPFRIADGRLLVAGPEIPSEALQTTLRSYTSLDVRFHLVTPAQFEAMCRSAG